jgi:hypothetical protein
MFLRPVSPTEVDYNQACKCDTQMRSRRTTPQEIPATGYV